MQKFYIVSIIGTMKILIKNKYILFSKLVEDKPEKYFDQNSKSIELATEINDYLSGDSKKLSSKYKMYGTSFQLKVWNIIREIPYGETRTYGEIASLINHPGSCRAVANACGQNKLMLFVPCHRVIGKNNIGGYKWGSDTKDYLLELENYCC